jgi:ribokinase
MDAVGLGYCTLDYVGIVPNLPGINKVVKIHDFARQGGGPAAQAMVTLARLGADVGFIGRIGDDEAGDFMRRDLIAEGVDVSRLQIEPGAISNQCMILVHQPTGKRSICVYHGTASDIRQSELDVGYVRAAQYLHLDGHSADTALDAARAARAAGGTVCLDAGTMKPGRVKLLEVTDVLIAGARFVQSFAGDANYQAGAARLLDEGPETVVVTLGEDGSFTKTRDEAFHSPAFAVPVVDTTGAGDVFHGAYLFGLIRGWDLQTTAVFASAAAALKCIRLGGRAGIPAYEAVIDFLRQRDSATLGEII